MANRIVTYALVALAVLGLGGAIYYNNRTSVPYSTQLEHATTRLIQQSPDIRTKLGELSSTEYTIVAGTLPGDILAQTKITDSGSTITVDVSKVKAKRDRLEPVIGHEIYHIWEAYYVYGGIPAFSSLVATEKPVSRWQNRTYEKTAIAREDGLRNYLIVNYPKDYVGMRATRELQNRQAR